jgi:hypothetical protein
MMNDEYLGLRVVTPSAAKVCCGNCGYEFKTNSDVEMRGHRCSFEPLKQRLTELEVRTTALETIIADLLNQLQAGK